MIRYRAPLAAFITAVLLVVGASVAAAADLRDASVAISDWQLPEARVILDDLASDNPSPELLFEEGRYRFYAGQYKMALDYMDQAITMEDDEGDKARYQNLRALVQSTHDVTKDYKEFRSPNGTIIIRIEAGKDEILLPYAFETLENAYVHIGNELGYKPPAPVLVEIYPRAATLAAVSGLTEDEIKTSGTIALCSYNRLMFTSPKALLKGYTWRDTLSHEFTHLVITQKSRNSVPIWMHEGLAKFEERRWRGDGDNDRLLSPSSENLLAKGIEQKNLITFEQMHPSMAKLPSQEATSLAFAEVYTVMEFIQARKGNTALSELLTHMREDGDPEDAITALMGMPFPRFLKEWDKYLHARPSRKFDEELVYVDKLEFVDGKNESELLEVGQKEARDFIHLGELLQARKRPAAAVVEYQKAHALLGDRNPILQSRLGRTLLELGRPDQAVEALVGSLSYYPTYFSTHNLLGQAYLEVGKLELAEHHLLEAIGINPFDPEPHENLAKVYERTGRPDLARRAHEHARMAGGGS